MTAFHILAASIGVIAMVIGAIGIFAALTSKDDVDRSFDRAFIGPIYVLLGAYILFRSLGYTL